MVGTVNMGGVFNFFAYMFVRRSTSSDEQRRQRDKNDATLTTDDTLSTVT